MSKPNCNEGDLRPKIELTRQFHEYFHGRGAVISIAGPDGAGKSTFASQLVEIFAQADLVVIRIHSYSWYNNIFIMPFRLARLRNQKQIVVLDRSIFDNVIEFSRKTHMPAGLLRQLLKIVNRVYVTFDHKAVLTTSMNDLTSRRPDESPKRISEQQKLYAELIKFANFLPLISDKPISQEAILNLMKKSPPPNVAVHQANKL